MAAALAMTGPRTLAQKIWDAHVVQPVGDGVDLVWLDRVVLHERMGAGVLQELSAAGRRIRRPDLAVGVMDHVLDTFPGRGDATLVPSGGRFIHAFREEAAKHGLALFDIGDPRQGIVHVVTPEQGIALPGLTVVCADSHTCTLGGLGALAWGIGTSEAGHALATQTLVLARPRAMRIVVEGRLAAQVTAKDLALYLIGRLGVAGGGNRVVEFAGPAVRALSVESRLTLCNMAVELGAWTGLVAPDETTFEYLAGRPYAPKGADWDAAVAHWRDLASDEGAGFEASWAFDASTVAPQVTWGTNPGQVAAIDGRVPDPAGFADPLRRAAAAKALDYAGLVPGTPFAEVGIDVAFIGSCTNARLDDLRAAAAVLRGRRVAEGVKAICVPGSTPVKRQAEAEGLDAVFRAAGFEWRESGCSLCFYAGGESFGDGVRAVTTTNRNFENRQGPGVRSHLASPATVAASALVGRLADVRRLEV